MTSKPPGPPTATPPPAAPAPPAAPPPPGTFAAPLAPAAPAAPAARKSPRATIPQAVALNIISGVHTAGERILLYGTPGIGKSTLASYLPRPFFYDIDRGTKRLNVSRDREIPDWPTLRGKLAALYADPKGIMSIVIDSLSPTSELGKEWVVETRRTEKGNAVDSVEGFGWGKGWNFLFDEYCALLADIDRIIEKHGINACLIAHEVTSNIPNPAGDDYIRWEPNLYKGDKQNRGSIRDRVKEWADDVFFIGYDVFSKDGKATGSGTRMIYGTERPTHMAKNRFSPDLAIPFTLQDPAALWRMFGLVS